MRVTVLALLEQLARGVEFPGPIYEFGSFRVPGQRHLPPVRSFFPGREFHGCDLQPGDGVDEVQDLHDLKLPDDSVGTALLFDTIEHVRVPWRALAEVRRCLQPGGVVVMTSHWYFPIHAYPDDYWRFTASGFRSLFEGLDPVAVTMCGLARLPHTVLGIASKGPLRDPGAASAIERIVAAWSVNGAHSWKETALECLPPRLLIPAYDGYLRLQALVDRMRGVDGSGRPE